MENSTIFVTHYGDRVEVDVDMTVDELLDVIEALEEMIDEAEEALAVHRMN